LLALREEVDKEIEKEIASLREISTRGRYVWKCTGGYGEATYIFISAIRLRADYGLLWRVGITKTPARPGFSSTLQCVEG
jgi:hypothetical protein